MGEKFFCFLERERTIAVYVIEEFSATAEFHKNIDVTILLLNFIDLGNILVNQCFVDIYFSSKASSLAVTQFCQLDDFDCHKFASQSVHGFFYSGEPSVSDFLHFINFIFYSSGSSQSKSGSIALTFDLQ